jgi:glycosyltransferase involved in cell wall biosynthesis
MRILHLSDQGLPDARVEKSAYSSKKLGHSNYFAGRRFRGYSFEMELFDDLFELPFTWRANVGEPLHWHRLKRKFQTILFAVKPDLIHAHNIIAANLASQSGLPYVLDDHELASVSTRMIHRELRYRFLHARIWERWENEVNVPVLTVSEPIALHYRKQGCNAYLVPNMPCQLEIDAIAQGRPPVDGELQSIYIGSGDFASAGFPEHRNMDGFLDLFKNKELGKLTLVGENISDPIVHSIQHVPHLKMMRELVSYHVGIIPWRPNAFHAYCNPNKAYEYVNAGLSVLVINDLTPVINTLGTYCTPFEDYHALVNILLDLAKDTKKLVNRREQIISYARSNFVWERYERNIFDAYKNA